MDISIDLSVIVPVYNNADTLDDLRRRLAEAISGEGLCYQLLFVDDRGKDSSSAVLRRLVDHYPQVTLVTLRRNLGQHAAVLHGIRFASGRWCVVMDADLQDPPEVLPRLWRARKEGCAIVFAGRRGHYQNRWRMATSRLYKWLLYRLAGLPRDAGIFSLFSSEVARRLLSMPVRLPWINVMLGLSGYQICSVPVERSPRQSGRSTYSGWGRFRSAGKGIYCALAYRCWPQGVPYLARGRADPVVRVQGFGAAAEPE